MKGYIKTTHSLIICILLCICFFTIGNKVQSKDYKVNLANSLEENSKLADEIQKLQDEIAILKAESDDKATAEMLPVYTADIDSYEKKIHHYVLIDESLPMMDNLSIIASDLSQTLFDGLIIQVKNYDEATKTLTVDLKENEDSDSSWKSQRFQGSAGGMITTTSLIESFLQREFMGDWIESVVFTYEGSPIEFQHGQELSEPHKR